MEEYAEALVRISTARKGTIVPYQGERGDGTMVPFAHRGLDAKLGLERDDANVPRATVLIRSGAGPWESMTRSGAPFGFQMKHDPPEGLLESVKGKLERGRFEVDENRPDWFVAASNQAQDLYDLHVLSVRHQLVPLFEFPALDAMSFVFTPYLFRARFRRPPSKPVQMEELLRSSLALFDALLDGDHERMRRYAKAAMATARKVPSWCGACGEDIQPPKVLCASCLLPQHADCWATLRRCASIGCGSTEQLAPE